MKQRVLAVVWLLGLSGYILAGLSLASFHGDESMQISMSRDFDIAFLQQDPLRLLTEPPYPIDSDQHLRIINGTINRYAIGLSWFLAGMTVDDLPPRPGWDWGLSYADGIATGHRLSTEAMTIMRLSSALFTCGSAVVLFLLGWQVGGGWLAVLASGVYALNPIILLNGRRATQEGSLLFFGLLVVLLAVIISRRRAENVPVSPFWWIGLVLAGGLALASKHTGIVFVAGALLWILAAEGCGGRRWRGLLLPLAGCGVAIGALFIALSPALWNNPPARLNDLLALRAELIEIQIAIDPHAPTTLLQRIDGILRQPFIAPLEQYELPSWTGDADFMAEVARYAESPLSGLQGGIPLTILAGVGLAVTLTRRRWQDVGLLVWFAVTAATLLVNPLPWQRYSLPLIPIMSLFAGLGGVWLAGMIQSPNSPLAPRQNLRNTKDRPEQL
jgi:4-amino-4-deoxy-L-arabinose transferase-like glycosyltransferase